MIGFSIYSPKVTPLSVDVVIDVGVDQDKPSLDVRTVPLFPTATKVLLPKATPLRLEPEEFLVYQVEPSLDVRILPLFPTATKIPLPKVTPLRVEPEEFVLLQFTPLSSDLMILPLSPTATKIPLPKATPLRSLVPELKQEL